MNTYDRYMAGKPMNNTERAKIKAARELARLLAAGKAAMEAARVARRG